MIRAIDYKLSLELNGMIDLVYPGSVYFVITRETADKISIDTNIRPEIVAALVAEFYAERSRLSVPVQ